MTEPQIETADEATPLPPAPKPPDMELTLLAALERAFRGLDDDARARVLRWAIAWHQEHTAHRVVSAFNLLQPATSSLTAPEKMLLLEAFAVLLDRRLASTVPAVASTRTRSTPKLASTNPHRARHCRLCGKRGHDFRTCARRRE